MLTINKPRGITPLQALDRLRKIKPELTDSKLAYAGRLDPQAEGLLLVLIDEECKQRDEFQRLNKIYEFELLLGIGTDTGDIMGIPHLASSMDVNIENIRAVLSEFIGQIVQTYPAYSSKTVNGIPMYKLAQQGVRPLVGHEIEIYGLKIVDQKAYYSTQLQEFIHKNISHVTGNFRQAEVLQAWNGLLASQLNANWQVIKLCTHVSSGTYIRQLCTDLGKRLNTEGLALSIYRQQVGEFHITDAIGV